MGEKNPKRSNGPPKLFRCTPSPTIWYKYVRRTAIFAVYVSSIGVLYGHICIARVCVCVCVCVQKSIFISRRCYFIETSSNNILPLLYKNKKPTRFYGYFFAISNYF